MSAIKAAFIHSREIELYHYPPQCPFTTERAGKVRSLLASMGALAGEGRQEVAPTPAGRDRLLAFHTPAYLDALENATGGRFDPESFGMGLGTPDCPIFEGMHQYADLACGASLKAAELILSGRADVAFNPSGGYHHAFADRATGFCYLNDVVLACMALAEAGRRVLVIDIDAHHCDAVQAAFYARCDVMTISFHESGRTLFPGTGFVEELGIGDGQGYSVNVPLPAGTYDQAFLNAFSEVASPLIGAYRPDVLVLELGMDALADDPLTHLCLTNNAHATVIRLLLECGMPMLVTGGGGYHVANTVRSWALAWCILCGQEDSESAGTLELADRPLSPSAELVAAVQPQLQATVQAIKAHIFPIHGL